MDEPTSALTETEVQRLLSIMDRLRKDGVAIMFVTHRLEEASADLRPHDGAARRQARRPPRPRKGEPIPLPRIIEKMVGRAASELYARPTQRDVAGDVRLSVRGLQHACAIPRRRTPSCSKASTSISGPARSSASPASSAPAAPSSPAPSSAPTASPPAPSRSTASRSRRPRPPTPSRSASGWCRRTASARRSSPRSASCPISPSPRSAPTQQRASASWPSGASARRWPTTARCCRSAWPRPSRPSTGLSGGNQQKVVLARWLARDPKVLIVDEPTRGVDVGAKAEVHQILVQLAARGIAVMMISSELPEVLAVSDRIVTMRRAASPARCRPSKRPRRS